MAFLHNQLVRRILLTLILCFGLASFYLVNQSDGPILVMILVISLIGLYFIWRETSAVFTLILLSFTTAYAFYTFFFQFNLPTWLVMVSILVIYSYLFTYMEQKIGILGNMRLIYLVLFSLVILEVFLALSYFLINPIGQSLIISAVSYLFVGFCYTVLAKHTDNKFATYVTISSAVILIVLLTSNWTSLV